jgi:hypothetical protein
MDLAYHEIELGFPRITAEILIIRQGEVKRFGSYLAHKGGGLKI